VEVGASKEVVGPFLEWKCGNILGGGGEFL
jgi:hypothetical protein